MIGIADTVVLVLMPGSGDSVQALKAGIMEIPDVIAINKMDQPAAKTMLNEVRSVLSLDPDAVAPADRPDRGAARRGRDELWEELDEHRAQLGAEGQLEERRRRNLAARGFAVASARARRTSRGVRGGPGAAPAARRGAAPRARPADRGARIVEKVFRIDGGAGTHRDVATSGGARSAWRAIARVTPVLLARGRSRGSPAGPSGSRPRTSSSPARSRSAARQHASRSSTEASGRAGVVTASAGNHGQAVAWAAREAGIRRRSSSHRTRRWPRWRHAGYGAAVELAGEGLDEAPSPPRAYVEATGATFVHAFEDARVIARPGNARPRAGRAAARAPGRC